MSSCPHLVVSSSEPFPSYISSTSAPPLRCGPLLCFPHAGSCSPSCPHCFPVGWKSRARGIVRHRCTRFVFPQTRSTRKQRGSYICASASSFDSLYDILGVSPTATESDIKRAYRKLALKYHPDVNKAPDAQQKFMSIKNAYQTLVDMKTRTRYDSSRQSVGNEDGFSWGDSATKKEQDDFYGIEDFFRDLQNDFQEGAAAGKPKSLWEELAEIGEEFVEFLEKELSIDDGMNPSTWEKEGMYGLDSNMGKTSSNNSKKQTVNAETKSNNATKDISEIEELLAKLKEELGL